MSSKMTPDEVRAQVAADNRQRMAIDALKDAGIASASYGPGGLIVISDEDAVRIANALGVRIVSQS